MILRQKPYSNGVIEQFTGDTPVFTKNFFHFRLVSTWYMHFVGQVHARPYIYMGWQEMICGIRSIPCIAGGIIYAFTHTHTHIYIYIFYIWIYYDTNQLIWLNNHDADRYIMN